MCEAESSWEVAIWHKKHSLVLSDDPEGWDGGMEGKAKREGICVCIELIHFFVQQKMTQHYKAIILQ